jgi:erythronate-4-phosphate dehydrogenase
MKRIKIIADDKIPFLKGAFEPIAEIQYHPGKEITPSIVQDADALIIRTRTRCDEKLLKGSSVSFIASATIGYDHIDTDYCRKKGIGWTNAPGCNSGSVEQYLCAALLQMADKHGFILKEKCIGIVGVGNVGSRISRIASALGMNVLLNDPPRAETEGGDAFTSLEQLKQDADIISFHVPLNQEGPYKTAGMADRGFFSSLAKAEIIINTSRGEIMDEEALIQFLKKDRNHDSVIDVWDNEPDINRELLELSGIATSHIAGYSSDGKARGTEMSVRAVSNYFNLGLDNWKAGNIPVPEIEQIVIDCGGMEDQEILHEVYLRTYDIMGDDSNLRNHPEKFEDIRGNYPVRREPPAYTVRLNNNPYEYLEGVLESLGFTTLELDCFC